MKNTKKLVIMAMIAAMAYVVVFVCHFVMPPLVEQPPLKLDFKDTIIALGGFMLGPVAAAAVSVVVSLIELITISSTGYIGLIMNIVSTCAFSCPAAFIYKKVHKKSGGIIGLLAGVLTVVAVMLLWNYIVTPLYYGMPRAAVVPLLPGIVAFNALKGGINMALTLLVYKPLVTALRKAGLLPKTETEEKGKKKISTGMYLFAGALLITCVLLALVLAGVI